MTEENLGTWSFVDCENAWWYIEGTTRKGLLIQYRNDKTKVQADFGIVWVTLGDFKTPQMKIFDDSWKALYVYGEDFLELLAKFDNAMITKENLKSELLKIGFKDETEYVDYNRKERRNMSIYKLSAQEVVYYNFYVRANNEEEARNIVYEIDKNLDQFISDSEGFGIDDVQDLGDAEYLPEDVTIVDINKSTSADMEEFLLKLTRTKTSDLEKMLDKELNPWKQDLIERQISENLKEIAFLFIRENFHSKIIKMLLGLKKNEQLFFFILYVGEDKEKNLYPDILVEALQEFDI